jgi:anti-sigma B factor antagonist
LLPEQEGAAMFSVGVRTRRCPGRITVALSGELDLVDASVVAVALAAAARRATMVIVDLTELKFIDASGVAALARGWHHARNAGGQLRLVAPRQQVRKMLDLILADGDLSASANAVRIVKPQDVRDPPAGNRPHRGRRPGSPGHGPCDCFKA